VHHRVRRVLYEEFRRRGVELLGLSVDTVYCHTEWKRHIERAFGVKSPFPIIADVGMRVASLFNAIPPGQHLTVRVVALIDPDLKLAWFAAHPYTNGRNIDEVFRVIDAIQFSYKYGYATPADWKPGDPVIMPPPATVEDAERRLKEPGIECEYWWFCTRKYDIVKA
jgi:peroxiredoxin (alkyl hydroperoxide reductase subunit C)